MYIILIKYLLLLKMYRYLTETCSNGLQKKYSDQEEIHFKIKSGNLLRTPTSLNSTTLSLLKGLKSRMPESIMAVQFPYFCTSL